MGWAGSAALADVNLQLQTVVNPVTVGDLVEVRLNIAGTPGNQNVGFVQTVLTWDQTKLQLTGISTAGAFSWASAGFFNDAPPSGDGLNAPYTGVPANDGNAVFRALSVTGSPAVVPPAGLRVTTFQFTAIGTGVNSPVNVPTSLSNTQTAVMNNAPFGALVTIQTISNTTVTVNCSSSAQCNDGNPCTDDSCVSNQCAFVNDNSNNPADGLRCNGVELSCNNGAIVYSPGEGPVDCSGLNTTCHVGVCTEPTGACTTSPINEGGSCNDGLFCTLTDTCSAGNCVGSGNRCPGQFCNETTDACVNCLVDANCADSEFCTVEVCSGGVCTDGGERCPGQVCLEVTDECVDCLSSSDCNDGLFCNGTETCNLATHTCQPGTSPCSGGTPVCCEATDSCAVECCVNSQCDDGHLCSADVCDISGACVNFANSAACQDGVFCNGAELCNEVPAGSGIFVCQAAQTPACTPGHVCCETTDNCGTNCCSDADCIDAFFCNGVETCVNGTCQAGTPPDCSSFTNSCNIGTCNETTDSCMGTPTNNGGACNDDNTCTYGDVCTNGVCDGCLQGEAGCAPQGCVNLLWDPPSQNALVGATAQVKLIARSCNTQAQPVDGIQTILNWDSTKLQLTPSSGPNPNPADPCTPSITCPPNTYDWLSSSFPVDCALDGLNNTSPCTCPCPGFPANDGNAFYTALAQLSPNPPASATQTGLHVTTFKFTVLPGPASSTQISINPCYSPTGSTVTRVIGGATPGTVVTGTIGSPTTITILQCNNDGQCNDGLDCNGVETCNVATHTCLPGTPLCSPPTPVCIEATNTCVVCTTNSHCDDGLFCNGSERCLSNQCGPGPDPCPGFLCDEVQNTCVECFTAAECDDGIPCTDDSCILGDCFHVPNNAACDDGLYCNGVEECIAGTGCQSPGNPCHNPADCNEVLDNCGTACEPPSVLAIGPRYISVTPPAGPDPVAILVTGNPNDATIACLSKYVQANGTLGTNPVFQTPATWGTVFVKGADIRPTKKYRVCTACALGFSEIRTATLWRYGDGNNNGLVNLDDILCTLSGFSGNFNIPPSFCTIYTTDLIGPGCTPNGTLTLDDILQVLNAFQGQSTVPALQCPAVCP